MEQLKSFVYIDAYGIDGLLAQMTPEVIEETQIQTTKKKSGAVKATASFSKLLKQLFNADIDVSGGQETVQIISQKTVEPYERKIQRLIAFIKEHGVLFSSIDELYAAYNNDKENFICTELSMDTDFDYAHWDSAVETAKQFSYISFYKGGPNRRDKKLPVDSYRYDDAYFKHTESNSTKSNENRINMNMSLQKMDPLGGITSHFYFLLKETDGIDIPLGVFGNIYKIAPSVYQIKPYAVWRTSKYLGF